MAGLVGFALVLLAAAAATGRTPRAYPVLDPAEMLDLGGNRLALSEAADLYAPRMKIRSSTPSPPLLWIWYEAVRTETTIDLVYYFVWENEINPNPLLHRLYALFRAAYYGYPLHDVEYFQVSVSPEDGKIVGMRFETGLSDHYFGNIQQHIVAVYRLQPDGSYLETRTTRSGELLSQADGVQAFMDETHAMTGVQTWNHLTRLLVETDQDFTQPVQAELKPLTARDYARYKFVRKSQGDHHTPESAWTLPIASLTTLIFIAVPAWMMARLRKGRSSSAAGENL